jgi:nitroreductase
MAMGLRRMTTWWLVWVRGGIAVPTRKKSKILGPCTAAAHSATAAINAEPLRYGRRADASHGAVRYGTVVPRQKTAKELVRCSFASWFEIPHVLE